MKKVFVFLALVTSSLSHAEQTAQLTNLDSNIECKDIIAVMEKVRDEELAMDQGVTNLVGYYGNYLWDSWKNYFKPIENDGTCHSFGTGAFDGISVAGAFLLKARADSIENTQVRLAINNRLIEATKKCLK